jgi:hypothetical protein
VPRAHSSPAVRPLPELHAPTAPIYRIARGPDPFEPVPWAYAEPDGTFGNRFDDPGSARNIPEWERFRAIYCATTLEGCFGETLAHFRRSFGLLAGVSAIEDDEPVIDEIDRPVIPADWRTGRRMGQTWLSPTLRFVDFAHAETWQLMRPILAPIAARFGLTDVDAAAAMSAHRPLTQAFARYVFEQLDDGQPRYAGIRYRSRLNLDWECWAVFDCRMEHTPSPPQAIHPDNPALLAVARLYGLRIESLGGRVIDP